MCLLIFNCIKLIKDSKKSDVVPIIRSVLWFSGFILTIHYFLGDIHKENCNILIQKIGNVLQTFKYPILRENTDSLKKEIATLYIS